MARKAKEYVETNPAVLMPDEALHAAHAVTLANEAELHAIKGAYSDERDLLNQLLGQAQMANAFGQFSVTVTTSKISYVKENKLYRALKGQKSRDGHGFLTGTWDEFCQLLGRSVEQVDEDIRNLKALGEEALESMSRMGIGYRELRQYRKLPEDQKTALIEAAKVGDKDTFLELAEDMIAKHAKEKEALAKQVEDLKADGEASARLLSDKNAKIDELTKIKSTVSPWDEKIAAFKTELAGGFDLLDASVGRLTLMHSVILQEDTKWADTDEGEQIVLRQLATLYGDRLDRLAQQLAQLQQHYGATLAGWRGELEGHVLEVPGEGSAAGGEQG